MMTPFRGFRILKRVQSLQNKQWESDEERNQRKKEKLLKVIGSAYESIPFYRELFHEHHISPEGIQSLEDLKKLPCISKKDIQKNYPHNILRRKVSSYTHIASTSGSTGIPLQIVYDQQAMDISYALVYFSFFENGLRFTDTLVEIGAQEYSPSWFRRMGFMNKHTLSVFSSMENIGKKLVSIQPDVVFSYPSFLYLFGKDQLQKARIKPRIIITYGEMLPESMRKELEEMYQAKVFNCYGAVECMRMGYECEKREGFHIIDDYVIVEVLRDNVPVEDGEIGEIYITSLYHFEMPLIRYKIGDLGAYAKTKCSCGRNYPLLRKLEGREDDYITLPSGRIISARNINYLEDISGIAMYKIVQEERGRFHIHVKRGENYSKETVKQVHERMKKYLEEDVFISICETDDIPKEKSGKIRTVVSNV